MDRRRTPEKMGPRLAKLVSPDDRIVARVQVATGPRFEWFALVLIMAILNFVIINLHNFGAVSAAWWTILNYGTPVFLLRWWRWRSWSDLRSWL
jgi:hypothetical protein